MAETPPVKFDQGMLERVLQRAAELSTSDREQGSYLSADEILALGREVGISERYLRQAMLEVQAQPEPSPEPGVLDRMIGPGTVRAQRVISLDQEAIERFLLKHLEEEAFRVQRQLPGRIVWEPGTGWQAFMRRSMSSGRPMMLQRASLVAATITPLEPGFAHVALSAELRQTRGGYIGGGAALGSIGLAGSAVLLALSAAPLIALAPLPFAAGLGIGVSRLYRPVAERAALGLEVALDALERGSAKPPHALPPRAVNLIGQIAGEIRRAIESPKPSSSR
jgi:hypothetical protein